MQPVDLSILVCGVHTRRSTFLPKIQDQLFGQYDALSEADQDRVEIIVLTDNKKMMLGEKRNVMVDMAQGRYVVFVDDDDRVSDDYVSALLEATRSDADAIVFQASVSIDGAPPKVCHYSRNVRRDYNTDSAYFRTPNHICCIKREISQLSSFPNISYGEDAAYSKVLRKHLRSEHTIDRVLYHYDFNSQVTETQSRVNMTIRQRRTVVDPVADVIILSKAQTSMTKRMTQNAINSCLAGANSLPVNIIVVEGHPGVTYENATVISNQAKFNYNRFANQAAAVSTAPWIVVANNDLEFTNGWLHLLLAAEHPCVSPRSPNDPRQADVETDERGYVNGRHFSGWCFMVWRETWEGIGGFDEDVSFWCSDDAVVEQLRLLGVEPMIVADSIVHHRTSKTIGTIRGDRRDDLTWAQVEAFNQKYGRTKFHDNPQFQQWRERNIGPIDPPSGELHIAVVAHPSRLERAEWLSRELGATMFLDTEGLGVAGNHLRVLREHAEASGHLIVLEDDAEPCENFVERAKGYIERFPADLISFYLGTGKPAHRQASVMRVIDRAEKLGRDRVKINSLMHAVGFAIPCSGISAVLAMDMRRKVGVDSHIGEAWRAATHRQVVYTLPSLVDHADEVSTHADPQAPRRAWRPPETTMVRA